MASTCLRNCTMTPEDEVFYQALGRRIAEARKAQGITQVQLAKILGVSQQTIAHYEGGRLRLVASLLPQIARAIGMPVIELMGEVEVVEMKNKRGPKSKLEQQIEQIRSMPRSRQKFISEMLDALIEQQKAS
jgi:transcriptional regulator with XRE-family HTH domain